MSDQIIEQGSAAFFDLRMGKLTASRIAEAFAKLKSGRPAKSRFDLLVELASERLSGKAVTHFTSADMMRGIELEPDAVATYEYTYDVAADPIGFVEHPEIPAAGASPDRAIGADGLLEVKCPKITTFLRVRLAQEHGISHTDRDETDDGYLMQVAWQIACARRAWCDLAYYCPDLPFGQQLYVRRIHRDEKIISAMEAEARTFIAELDDMVARLRAVGRIERGIAA